VLPASVDSVYITGREIGDEYRYILDRKYAQKFPAIPWIGRRCCSILGCPLDANW